MNEEGPRDTPAEPTDERDRGGCRVTPRERMPSWLSTEDVARELGMTPQWVRRQVAERRLSARVDVTGRRRTIRIRRSCLEEFLGVHALDPNAIDP